MPQIKFTPGTESEFLLRNYPNAMLLLMHTAMYAKRSSDDTFRECYIGDHEACGLSRKQYRTALTHLSKRGHLEIIETCRTRTTGATIGTKVKILRSDVWDISLENEGHRQKTTGATERATDFEAFSEEKTSKEISILQKEGHRPLNPKNLGATERATESLCTTSGNSDICNQFFEHEGHRKGHVSINRLREDKKESIINDSEKSIDIRPILSHEGKEEEIEGFRAYTEFNNIPMSMHDIRIWLKFYDLSYISDTYQLLLSEAQLAQSKTGKQPIRNPGAWMQKALQKNYSKVNQQAELHRKLALNMQKNGWPNLHVTSRYAADKLSGKEFMFNNPDFEILITREYDRCQQSA